MYFRKHKTTTYIFTFLFGFITIFSLLPVNAFASPEVLEIIEEHKALPISSNAIPGWPQGPVVCAESACLIDATNGTVLYDKNMNKAEFPASTTKVMTCLLAAENCSMDEMVTFSKNAVFGIERDSSNVGMDVGQSITMEEALYCIMLASANEVASAVAEHVGGSIEEFADMMNKKAAELGCTNTHFSNANGLHDDNHYTTAHDLALITKAYFENEKLSTIANTTYYEMHATDTQPDEFGIANHHKMLPGKDYAYDYLIGGKTGYTNRARQTLVSCAEKDGMKLVCVVMRDEAPHQWTDTKDLFEYGFANYKWQNVSEVENRYTVDNANFFQTTNNLFGETKTLFSIDTDSKVLLPSTIKFSDLDHEIQYNDDDSHVLATIFYSYQGIPMGSARIMIEDQQVNNFEFGTDPAMKGASASMNSVSENEADKPDMKVVFINLKPIFIIAGIVIAGIIILFLLIKIIIKIWKATSAKRESRRRRRRYHYHSDHDDFDF